MPKLPLFEGIIVRPSGGRRRHTPIDLPGSNVHVSHGKSSPIHITAEPAFVDALASYPIKVDISEHLRLQGAEPPFDIAMVDVREFSNSVEQRPWTGDDPFITMDKNGIITYTPRGTYFSNALVIKVKVADKENILGNAAQEIGEVYQGENPLPPGGINPNPVVDGLNETEVAVLLQNAILGMPEQWEKFWQHQGPEPTCALVAASSILLSLGKTDADGNPLDYKTVLEDATTVILNDEGEPLYKAESTREIWIEPSKPSPPMSYSKRPDEGYFIIVRGASVEETEDYLFIAKMLNFTQGAINYLEKLLEYRKSDDYDGYITTIPGEVQGGINRSEVVKIFTHYGVPTHMGYGDDFRDVIRLLEDGRRLYISVDAKELFNNRYIKAAQENGDEFLLNYLSDPLESTTNHGIWLTGFDFSDPENPVAIVNDSGAGLGEIGRGEKLPLDVFFSVWKDSFFAYIATGDALPPAPEATLPPGTLTTIRERIRNNLVEVFYGDTAYEDLGELQKEGVDGIINVNIDKLVAENPSIVDPETKEIYDKAVEERDAERNKLYIKYNIDPEEVQRLQDEADN